MSWILASPLARTVALMVEPLLPLRVPRSHVGDGKKSLVEYAHLANFKDLVELKLNPLDYEGFEIQHFVSFDRETQTTILQAISSGNHPVVAAELAGVPKKKLEKWMQLGEEGIEPFAGFFTECIKAFGYSSAAAMKVAMNSGDPTMSSAARWWLERLRPDLYAKKETVNQTNITSVTTQNFMTLKPEERAQYVKDNKITPSMIAKQRQQNNVIEHSP